MAASFTSSRTASPTPPKLPSRGSRRISSRRSRVTGTNSASQQSAQPSRCSAPVRTTQRTRTRAAGNSEPGHADRARRCQQQCRTERGQRRSSRRPTDRRPWLARPGCLPPNGRAPAGRSAGPARATVVHQSVFLAHAGLGEGRHLAQQASCGVDQVHGQHRARALAQAQTQVKSGRQAQVSQRRVVAGLCRSVAGDHDRRVRTAPGPRR